MELDKVRNNKRDSHSMDFLRIQRVDSTRLDTRNDHKTPEVQREYLEKMRTEILPTLNITDSCKIKTHRWI